MELEVVEGGRRHVSRLVLHALVHLAQPGEVLVARALGGEAGDVHLEHRSHLVHLLELDAAPVHEQAHRLAHRSGVDRSHPEPAPRPDLDHALRNQGPHCLADDRARDAELLAQLPLGRETVADGEPPGQNRVEHHLGDLVGQPRLARHLLEQHSFGGPACARLSAHVPDHTSYGMPPHVDVWYAVV